MGLVRRKGFRGHRRPNAASNALDMCVDTYAEMFVDMYAEMCGRGMPVLGGRLRSSSLRGEECTRLAARIQLGKDELAPQRTPAADKKHR